MAQTQRIGAHKTTVSTQDGITRVTYHYTDVVTWDRHANTVTLRSGGWERPTTKLRMNQTANQFDLGYHVYQEDHLWYVVIRGKDGLDWANPILFRDGMTIQL